jgi:nucleoside-diphosphate-sugar epimerase
MRRATMSPRASRRRTCVVTGAAGFIGSHLCERLCADGWTVIGIDCRPPTDVSSLAAEPRFALIHDDVVGAAAVAALPHAGALFHLAARTGVRGTDEIVYVRDNVDRTKRLLSACWEAQVGRFIYASSSSVYGAVGAGRQREDSAMAPVNPYGRSKLQAEWLCRASSLFTVALRFFTVYGPRQRPDMAFARFIAAALTGEAAPLHGGGSARDFTFVEDAVEGCMLAARSGARGYAYNISGGHSVQLADAVSLIEAELGLPVPLTAFPSTVVEANRTCADLTLASAHLGYSPAVALLDGMRAQLEASRLLHLTTAETS